MHTLNNSFKKFRITFPLLGVFLFVSIAAPAYSRDISPSPAAISAANTIANAPGRQDVKWDKATVLEGDFNDDRQNDFAMIGYVGRQVVIGMLISTLKNGTPKVQTMQFDIYPNEQASKSKAPAIFELETLTCGDEDRYAGCRPSKKAKSIALGDGDSDTYHLYWHAKTNMMQGWRR